MATTVLTLVDGVRIVAPDSLRHPTTYVLREQQDWFEDEVKFLRLALQPGDRVIDIGANCGVYALTMARTVGPEGCVWAFEPASATAQRLAAGVSINGFGQVIVEQSALSNFIGTATLSLESAPELNSLARGDAGHGAAETVPVTTLDSRLEAFGWQQIDFLKIDAEGEEANILKGGARFFTELSPLVQFEVKAGADLHLELVGAFQSLGYASYRLVPGLNLLVPFDAAAPVDGYLLNLFCCKSDRAAILAGRGFLVSTAGRGPGDTGTRDGAAVTGGPDAWHDALLAMPYGAQLAELWGSPGAGRRRRRIEDALALFFAARDSSRPPPERFRALENSFRLLQQLCGSTPLRHMRLASLARVGRDYGARSVAAGALTTLAAALFQQVKPDLSEPFLAPGRRFDSVPAGADMTSWILAATLEELERLVAFSSYYTDGSARQRLEIIRDLGRGSEEMQRRLDLLLQLSGGA